MLEKHFVIFSSPGTFVHEETMKPIGSWDVALACEMSEGVVERHDARPFAFRFITKQRTEFDLDSRVVKTSKNYYLGGKVLTLDEIKSRNNPKDSVLISNMECNNWDRVIENCNSWKVTLPLQPDDVILESW